MRHCVRQDIRVSFIKALGNCLYAIAITEEAHITQQEHRYLNILQENKV